MRTVDAYIPSGMDQINKISVIVAVYNIEAYIVKCARSIMGQKYRNLEIILVDDGSTDRSGVCCDELADEDSRVRVIHKSNGGLSDARNAGIEASTGDFIAFVDGDDWIDTEMYRTMLSAILEFHADIAVCRYKQVYRDRVADASTGKAVIFEGREALRCFLEEDERYQIQNAAWNKLYRRELLGDMRFPVGRWYEDIVYTTVLLSKCRKCVYLDTGFYHYVVDRDGSIMNNGINPRIFTHQIPAYFEKKAVLEPLGDEFTGIHEYYFYKRLLLYYTEVRRGKETFRKQQMRQLNKWIREAKPFEYRMFQWKGAKQSDRKKLKLFLFSPTLYYYVMRINDAFLIPIKEKRQARGVS